MSLPGGGAILVVPGNRNGAGGVSGLAVWRGARCSNWFSTAFATTGHPFVVTPPSERTMVATAVRTTAGSLFAQVPLRVMSDGVTHIGIGQHRIVGFDGTGG
jgi:hypothetical protein